MNETFACLLVLLVSVGRCQGLLYRQHLIGCRNDPSCAWMRRTRLQYATSGNTFVWLWYNESEPKHIVESLRVLASEGWVFGHTQDSCSLPSIWVTVLCERNDSVAFRNVIFLPLNPSNFCPWRYQKVCSLPKPFRVHEAGGISVSQQIVCVWSATGNSSYFTWPSRCNTSHSISSN